MIFDKAMETRKIPLTMSTVLVQSFLGVGNSTSCILLGRPPPKDFYKVSEVTNTFIRSQTRQWHCISRNDIKADESMVRIVAALMGGVDLIQSHGDASLPCSITDKQAGDDPELEKVVNSLYDSMVKLLGDCLMNESGRKSVPCFNLINLIDSCNEPHFHHIFSYFSCGSTSVVMLDFPLLEKTGESLRIEHYLYGEHEQILHPIEDSFKYVARHIQTINPVERPLLVMIGTQIGETKISPHSLVEKNELLSNFLVPELEDCTNFIDEDFTEVIIPLNGQNPGENEKSAMQILKEIIDQKNSSLETIPLSWFVLLTMLKQLACCLHRSVIHIQDCLRIAAKLEISKDSLVLALNFFSKHHICNYYPDILPNIVFTNPQVFINKVMELIGEAGSSTRRSFTHSPYRTGKLRKFRHEGIITIEFLQQFKKHYMDIFTPSDFLRMLEIHHLVIPDLDTHPNPNSENRYFMPALLGLLSSKELEENRIFSSLAKPILLIPKNGWPPPGVFSFLQVFLMQRLKWKLVLSGRQKPKVFKQNCIKLAPPDTTGTVTLIDSFKYFEVHVNASPSICRKICHPLLEDICNGIKKACEKFGYEELEIEYAFFDCCCPQEQLSAIQSVSDVPHEQRHIVKLYQNEGSVKCMDDECEKIQSTEEGHTVWIHALTTADPSKKRYIYSFLTSNSLSLSDINKECKDDILLKIAFYVTNWEVVATCLGLSSSVIEAIKYDYPTTEMRRIQTLKKWKSMASLENQATYQALIGVLLDCGLEEAVLFLCKQIRIQHSYGQ